MAETGAGEPVPSSSELGDIVDTVSPADVAEGPPPEKKRRLSERDIAERLEYRLGGILCCAVCLDLPRAAVYQCSNGHLMCAACFTHLLADARLRDEAATCPNCRVEISKASASRNLAVEKAVSELPANCKYCAGEFPRHALKHHEDRRCDEREIGFFQIVVNSIPMKQKTSIMDGLFRVISNMCRLVASTMWPSAARRPALPVRFTRSRLTGCRYAVIGCPWRGPAHEAGTHETACAHPAKSAADVVEALEARDRNAADVTAVHNQILDLLSYEKITFNDLQLKPYRTEEFVHKLYYETSRFSAFNHQWVVKAFVNKNQRDPTQSSERELTYQVLILKTKSPCALCLQYVAVRGPCGEVEVRPRVYAHTFPAEGGVDAPPQLLPLADPADANRLLASKAIHLRGIGLMEGREEGVGHQNSFAVALTRCNATAEAATSRPYSVRMWYFN
ncbi:Cysteine and histidine-rich protein 1 homolog [Eumeta japonica]|uniref:Cysteine and histidine-rich protein 1 homolog n=1 Tax=Eumeta variegata TaxID=151549 RepID=A0A4C1UZQ3_EUMVA|nr:Cysteine and histidine-rich protein 1 homolog [Eumeta japonica]